MYAISTLLLFVAGKASRVPTVTSYLRGVEQGGKSSFSLLSEPISPSSLLFRQISPSSLKFNLFFLPLPYFFPLFLPPPNFVWAISPSSIFCSSPLLFRLDRWITSETLHDMQIAVARATQLCRPTPLIATLLIRDFWFGAITRTREGACTVISRLFPRSVVNVDAFHVTVWTSFQHFSMDSSASKTS